MTQSRLTHNTMELLTEHLPFWHFFHELEKQLSYERWIDKYKLFLGQLYSPGYLTESTDDPEKLLQLCKALYLQNIKDEKRFELLFSEAWHHEQKFLETCFQSLLAQRKRETKDDLEKPETSRKDTEDHGARDNTLTGSDSGTENERPPEQKPSMQQTDTSTKEYYYNPPDIPLIQQHKILKTQRHNAENAGSGHLFNFQDEYLPITRREMNKAWQYLRHTEMGSLTDIVNIPATVNKLAKDTLFTEPVFVSGKKNRNDTLLLFVDCNGSMVPFHELSRRLVSSAKAYGGHSHAGVFYFQNYPLGYVFGRSNLTKPCKTIESFTKANKQFTTAVIISDAGFAKSYGNDDRYKTRLNNLAPFFKMLSERCAHTLWLNPMPENRWHKATAEYIQSKVLRMAPILEKGMNTFQSIVRNLIKVNQPTTNL